ncbi:MAG: GAF domain-containing protein, partial [candidate division Zixibacteria bacterium]|nr:GAF domain-containing protein [candidate division Zixibacteria bacterium]
MINAWGHILLPLLTALVIVFVALRLRLFADGGLAGRWSFVFGGLLVLLAAIWQTVKTAFSYYEWFIQDAYYWLEWGQLVILLSGVILIAVGLSLYSDYWQTRGEQIALRDRRLSLMENLQLIAREPYQLLQLLDISLKEMLSELPDASGCVFLMNRARRQLVLTASANLTPEETTLLEHYPFGRNLVSRTAELGEPSLAADFELFDRSGKLVISRFQSSLLLPLVSSSERIGVFVLLGESRHFFSPGEIRYLAPAVQWLAEKIKSARLTRELTVARNEVERHQTYRQDMLARLTTAGAAFSSADTADAFCRSLVGLHGAESVHLVGMAQGGLMFPGGSEPMLDLTENYKTAVVDALDRERPLIINQEVVGEQDRTVVAQSTLLYPLGDRSRPHALLFRREGGPFKVAQDDLKTIGVFARLAQAVLKQKELSRTDITRRKGFDKVLSLLRFDSAEPLESDTDQLVKHVSGILPSTARVVVLTKHPDGSFRAPISDEAKALHLLPGEGVVAEAAGALEPVVIRGCKNVAARLEELQLANREACFRLLGEKEAPSFMAAYPLVGLNDLACLILVFIQDGPEGEQAEWERLLTLALGLYSVRMTVAELRRHQTVALPNDIPGVPLGGIVNRLNNHLSALIGNAELGMTRADQPVEVRRYLESIVDEADKAARYVRSSLGHSLQGVSGSDISEDGADDINDIITAYLDRVRISDSLYMVAGRPREIFPRLFKTAPINTSPWAIERLVEEAVGHLAS